jgi:hypothetical protein
MSLFFTKPRVSLKSSRLILIVNEYFGVYDFHNLRLSIAIYNNVVIGEIIPITLTVTIQISRVGKEY